MKKPKKAVTPDNFETFAQMLQALPSETDCRQYLEQLLWGGTPICPKCGSQSENHYKLKKEGQFNGLYKCRDCRQRFTVTVGTMFEGSHAPLRKWFIAMYIFTSHKKGISSIQLGKDLGVTQKTAWFMLHRLRHAFNHKPDKKLTGVLQVDESYVGGKNKNRHADKKVKNTQGRSTKDKTPVFGIVKNGTTVHTAVVTDTKAETIKPIIKEMVATGSIVVSDDWTAYSGLNKDYNHIVVKHNEDEYVSGGFTTNNIENFWSLLKRGIYGIYHHASPKHLHRYCDEFSHRYNTRVIDERQRFDLTLKNNNGRLKYETLIRGK